MVELSSVYRLSEKQFGGFRVATRDRLPDPFGLLRAEWLPREPIEFKYDMGGKIYDVIATTYGILLLLNDRVLNVLRDEGVTGWTTYPVTVTDKKEVQIEGYHGFAVTGRCGCLDDTRRQLIWKPPHRADLPAYQVWKGLYFDEETWDGSDIFCPMGTGDIPPRKCAMLLVVERVKHALEKARVTNARFGPVSEFETRKLSSTE